MKRLLSLAAVFAMLTWPMEAHTSGSSKVVARGKSFSVEEESARKIFAHDSDDPNQERDWHKDWRDTHQPIVKALAKKIEHALSQYLKTSPLPLTDYDPKLPQVLSWSHASDDHSYEKSLGHPVRYLVRFYDRKNAPESLYGVRLDLAFSQLPTKVEIEALLTAIEKAVK